MEPEQSLYDKRRDQLKTLPLEHLQDAVAGITGKPCTATRVRDLTARIATHEQDEAYIGIAAAHFDEHNLPSVLNKEQLVAWFMESTQAKVEADLKQDEDSRASAGYSQSKRSCTVCGFKTEDGQWHKCCPTPGCDTPACNSIEEITRYFGWRVMPAKDGYVKRPQGACKTCRAANAAAHKEQRA